MEITGVLIGIAAFAVIVFFIKLAEKQSKENYEHSNIADIHSEECEKKAKLRHEETVKRLAELKAKNDKIRNRCDKTSVKITLMKKDGKSQAQIDEEKRAAKELGLL